MADRFPAVITIGGRIPRRLLYELAGVIRRILADGKQRRSRNKP